MPGTAPHKADLPPAVLCPLDDHMGLDIARNLSARGIRVYAIDSDRSVPGRFSNACTFVHCPCPETDEQAYIDFLLNWSERLAGRAVLYPLSDTHVLLLSKYRDLLAPRFAYVMPSHDTMVGLTTKDGLDSVARAHSIAAPRTWFLPNRADIGRIAEQVTFPAILKPTESTYWHTEEITRLLRKGLLEGQAKAVACHRPEDLVSAFEQIAVHDPRMIVQEVIPGEDSRLVYAPVYVGRDGAVLGYFSGRKLRVIPTGFGSASFVETFSDRALRDLVFEVLSAVGYRGLGGLEFKQDPRDGRYKLIEFNTRFGMWDALGTPCGVDLAYISYLDALGLPVESQLDPSGRAKWVDWQRDLRAFIEYRKRGQLTIGEWRRSYSGPKMLAIYSIRDPRPGLAFSLQLVRRLAQRVRGRLLVRNTRTAGRAPAP
jgi:predicted ATP-grasp superfamily ATP-dependent carboligase